MQTRSTILGITAGFILGATGAAAATSGGGNDAGGRTTQPGCHETQAQKNSDAITAAIGLKMSWVHQDVPAGTMMISESEAARELDAALRSTGCSS